MPQAYPNPNDLIADIIDRIKANGAEEITGPIHQDVLLNMVLSFLYYLNAIPLSVVNTYPAWDNAETYPGGVETVVRHNDKLWVFVSTTDDLGTEPGTNAAVWVEVSALQLAHWQNKDQYLDLGGPYQVSAQEIREHIDNLLIHSGASSQTNRLWLFRTVVSAPPSSPNEGDTYGVASGAIGAWSGQGGKVAKWVSGAWTFENATNGDFGILLDLSALVTIRQSNSWIVYDLNRVPSLYEVLNASANSTGPTFLQLERPLRYSRYSMYHGSPGSVTLPTATYPRISMGLSADIELGHDGVDFDCEITLYNDGASDQAITYAVGFWEAGNGLPQVIAPGEVIVLQVRGIPGGLATVISNSQTQRNAMLAVLDDDSTAAADSASRVMTQRATKAHVQAAIDAILNGAGSALDTLLELGNALGNDPNFAASMTAALAGKQPLNSVLTTLTGTSTDAQEMLTAANYAAMRALLGLVPGVNVQPYSATLAVLNGASLDGLNLVAAANFGVMRTLLGLVIGTNVQAQNANLQNVANNATGAGLAWMALANAAAMRSYLSLTVGTDVQAQNANLQNVANNATAAGLAWMALANAQAMRAYLGAIYQAVSSKSANFTVAASERGVLFQVTTAGSTITATLPDAATAGNGFPVIIRKVDTGSGSVVTSPATRALLHEGDYMELVSDGTTWTITKEPSATIVIPLISQAQGTAWTSMPAALNFYATLSGAMRIDLSGRRLVRLSGIVATAGSTGAKYILRYRSTYSATASDYSDFTVEVSFTIDVTGARSSPWVAIPVAAQGDVYVALFGSGGNGSASPLLRSVVVELH
ncbi:MAG: DUF2793 domain-containing protein [Flavobacteriales bacterium]|nr:DUF2793 domain-containing protein [Flavobacteriales bacterium]